MADNEIKAGDKVIVLGGDGDGAAGLVGTVKTVYRSGRCCVTLPDGGFRNLPQKVLRRTMSEELELPLWKCKDCGTSCRSDPVAQNWTSRYGGAWTGPNCPKCQQEMQVVHEDTEEAEYD